MDLLIIQNGNIEIEKINLSQELENIIEELTEIYPEAIFEKEIAENLIKIAKKYIFHLNQLNISFIKLLRKYFVI